MRTHERSIKDIETCYGCGVCAGICPNNALSMMVTGDIGYYRHSHTKENCTNCGKCLQVCPWNNLDVDLINNEIFGENSNSMIGQYIDCYTGYAINDDIRRSCSSGGIVSSILIYMLKRNMIQGVIVTKMSSLDPTKIEPFIARNVDDIVSATGSKYASVSFDKVIKEIKDFDGELAVVGLPCHIQAIRKLESIDQNIKKKIKYHLGLMCSGTIGLKGTKILLDSFEIPKESINSFSYRGNGWPGGFSVHDGHVKRSIRYPLYISIIRTYLQPSCLMCWDSTNEFSDISFGDAWELVNEDNIGTSLLITRTIEGDKLLKAAKLDSMIDISKIDASKVLKSQSGNISFKKHLLEFRLFMFEVLFGNRPNFCNVFMYKDINVKNILRTFMLFIRTYLSNNRYTSKIVDHITIYILKRNIK